MVGVVTEILLADVFNNQHEDDAVAFCYPVDRLLTPRTGTLLSDLDRHFRVTFMEPQGDELRITSYYNSEIEMPQTMARGLTLKKGIGVAGKAWELGEPFVVPDVQADLAQTAPIFQVLTPPHKRLRIKSIVSIPVFERNHRGEALIGILNLDSDRPNEFRDTDPHLSDLLILLRPFLRFIEWAYTAAQQPLEPKTPRALNLPVAPGEDPDLTE